MSGEHGLSGQIVTFESTISQITTSDCTTYLFLLFVTTQVTTAFAKKCLKKAFLLRYYYLFESVLKLKNLHFYQHPFGLYMPYLAMNKILLKRVSVVGEIFF